MKRASATSDRPPVSVPLLFAPVFLAVYLLHLTLLRLPYFWDEGGYYIPAAWDFFRLGTLIPESTMRNAHPPLPSILLAAWWNLAGFHVVSTRLLMCLVTTCALLAVFRLGRMLAGEAVGLSVMVLTAIYPVWFAQSTLAHADMFAAAFALWALTFYADRQAWTGRPSSGTVSNAISTALLFALACLSKETAIVLPAALFLLETWQLVRAWRAQDEDSRPERSGAKDQASANGSNVAALREHALWMIALTVPALLLFAWYLYHRAKTGFMFGNPEFLRYNATANLSLMRVLLSLRHRAVHLLFHLNLFLAVLSACAVLLLPSRLAKGQDLLSRGALRMLLVLLVAQWVAFSVLGGALLTRYLLPAYPMLLLLCVAAWKSRVRRWPVIALLVLFGFAVGCEVNPPYPFAPEDNLAYRDMIVLHQHAIRYLQQHYAGATVLTAWPVAADLQRPELGYLHTPMKTVEVDNFSSEQIQKAAQEQGAFDAALVFSTKYDPQPLSAVDRTSDAKFYDYHRDLPPEQIAQQLGGKVMWQEQRKGQWAAVLYFPRGYDVLLQRPAPLWEPLARFPLEHP